MYISEERSCIAVQSCECTLCECSFHSGNPGSHQYAYQSSYSNRRSVKPVSVCPRLWVEILDAEAPGVAIYQLTTWQVSLFNRSFPCFFSVVWGGLWGRSCQGVHFRSVATAVAPMATDFPACLCRTRSLRSLNAPVRNEIHRREPWRPELVIQMHPWEEILLIPLLSLCPGQWD